MRWHVYGTDAVGGRDIELILEEEDATRAIKAAMDRQIVVGNIVSLRARAWRRMITPLMYLLLLAAIIALGGLYLKNIATQEALADRTQQIDSLRKNLEQTLAEQTRLAGSLAQAQHLVAEIQGHGNLAALDSAQVKQLADDLLAARSRMSLTEQQLSAAHKQMDDLEQKAGRVPELEIQLAGSNAQLVGVQSQLKAGEAQVKQLREELTLQGRRMEQLAKAAEAPPEAVTRVAALEKANLAMVAENEKLKNELLVTAAVSSPSPDASGPNSETATGSAMRWALRVPYDAAKDFLIMHVDRDSLTTAAGADGMLATSGLQLANAAKLRFVHDRAKERVYDATLMVSLAADGPKDKLAENAKLVGDFVQAFAPGLKDADGLATMATEQLNNQDSSRRLMLLGEDSKVTVWNNRAGVYTIKVESARGEVE